MEKPVLVVLAAGMGSRYGGLKQIDPVGEGGQLILDYSVYDAKRAGFEKVVFVIKRELEETFRRAVGDRLEGDIQVEYAFQDLGDLPEGCMVPEGRVKPWGTAHAALAARHIVDGPFVVINSDDYYGPEAYRTIYNYLTAHPDGDLYEYAMVGFQVGNTVTENGSVARGVCVEDEDNFLLEVTERTNIETAPGGARFTVDGGESWTYLPFDTIVSMNMWGFNRSYLDEAWARFPAFLGKTARENPLKGEYYLPTVVSDLLKDGKARVKVLRSSDKWYGVTYQEDKPAVTAAIARMTASGLYPSKLWGRQA